jgi:hypothetical protein
MTVTLILLQGNGKFIYKKMPGAASIGTGWAAASSCPGKGFEHFITLS